MDERRAVIRELEDKNRADSEAVNRLYENLGETLFQRIGEGELFPESSAKTGKGKEKNTALSPPVAAVEGDTPEGLLEEYRKLHSQIAESRDIIKSLESDILRLKELEADISEKEGEQTKLENEFDEVNVKLGKALMEVADYSDPLKAQEEAILAKIDEQERKQTELEGREGGIFAWIGKNAQMAVSKGLLLKNKFALQRLYRSAGEKFVSSGQEHVLSGEAGETADHAREIKEQLSALAVNLAMLKGERRNMGDLFSTEGSPARRIQEQEKHINHVQGQFPGVHRRLGSLAAASEERGAFASILNEEDALAVERAHVLVSQIGERDLIIRKVNASISIDDEKAEIEKLNRTILSQRQKIAAAEEAITALEQQISESEKRIDKLDLFIKENGGI